MLSVKPNLVSTFVEGVDQQDFQEIQVLQGAFPYLSGLQQRIPGKTIQQVYPGAVGSIYVFYQVYGRTYIFVDYGPIVIYPVVPLPITIPIAPPLSNTWFETFDEYTPIGSLNFFWPQGAWFGGPGICQSRLIGFIDPFDGQAGLGIGAPGPPGGLGGASSTGAAATPTPPTPPPPPDTPQYPVDCSTMPNLGFISVSISIVFSSITAKSGNNNTFVNSPGQGPYNTNYNIVSSFTPTSPVGLFAQRTCSNSNAFVGTGISPSGFQYQDISVDTRTKGVYIIAGYPIDAIFYLVGTKTIANGMIDIHGNGLETTSCACLRIGIGGVVGGVVTLAASLGTDWLFSTAIDGTTSKGNFGSVEYTEVRVFSSTYT